MSETAFLTNVIALRDHARKSLEDGAITPNYTEDAEKAGAFLQTDVAIELVCVTPNTMHAISASGIDSESAAAEFAEHAEAERRHMRHMMQAPERIARLGGVPDFSPEGLASRSATECGNRGDLVQMIKNDLVTERIVIGHYRELIRYFGDQDFATRVMREGILAEEEEHASDMHDMLFALEDRSCPVENLGRGL
jgi:bacterioferritin